MSKNKKIFIICTFLIISLGILAFLFLNKPKLRKESYAKILESFESQMRPVDIDQMNIVLFTIDTLRADHLECYGYDRVKTPNINRLASEGILFEHNIVQAPLTLPSHSSIFT